MGLSLYQRGAQGSKEEREREGEREGGVMSSSSETVIEMKVCTWKQLLWLAVGPLIDLHRPALTGIG